MIDREAEFGETYAQYSIWLLVPIGQKIVKYRSSVVDVAVKVSASDGKTVDHAEPVGLRLT